jgi:hypothetical protein
VRVSKFVHDMGLFNSLVFLVSKPLILFVLAYAYWDQMKELLAGDNGGVLLCASVSIILLIYFVEAKTMSALRRYRVPNDIKIRDVLWQVSLNLHGTQAETIEDENMVVGEGTSRFATSFVISRSETKQELVVSVYSEAFFPISLVGWYIHHTRIDKALKGQGAYET